MNNIAYFRRKLGLTQAEVTAELKKQDPRVDGSMVSRFENEVCYPTPRIMRCLCNIFGCMPEDLYGVGEQEYFTDIVTPSPVEPESLDVTELMSYLHYGKQFALSRRTLCGLLDKSDRQLRRTIEEARNCGYVILADGTGGGYYLSDNVEEIHAYYHQERARAMSVLRRLGAVRRTLREAGRKV